MCACVHLSVCDNPPRRQACYYKKMRGSDMDTALAFLCTEACGGRTAVLPMPSASHWERDPIHYWVVTAVTCRLVLMFFRLCKEHGTDMCVSEVLGHQSGVVEEGAVAQTPIQREW